MVTALEIVRKPTAAGVDKGKDRKTVQNQSKYLYLFYKVNLRETIWGVLTSNFEGDIQQNLMKGT